MTTKKIGLSHFGVSCFDLDRMEDFYTRVLGFTVTDRGMAGGMKLVFLSRDPREHHQLLLNTGPMSEAVVCQEWKGKQTQALESS